MIQHKSPEKAVGILTGIKPMTSFEPGFTLNKSSGWYVMTTYEEQVNVLCCHVELHHCFNLRSGCLVALRDRLGSQKAGLLSRIPKVKMSRADHVYIMSSTTDQWNSTGVVGLNPDASNARKASIRLTEPLPSSSAPGARPMVGLLKLMESMCAPRMVTGPVVIPGIRATMELWTHVCLKAVTVALLAG
jgi:hypothetical protein